jgi:hypothetical protein
MPLASALSISALKDEVFRAGLVIVFLRQFS